MKLYPHQKSFVADVQSSFIQHDRVLGVSPTGSGKTIMASELVKRFRGKTLFLADAKELVYQGADKIGRYLGEEVGVEMAQSSVDPADNHRVIVATSQSIGQPSRLEKYPPDRFDYIIVDEAHRNTLGVYPSRIFGHFHDAKVLGVTATPFRTDKRSLAHVYETIAHEIKLIDLIRDGYLSRITVKTVPVNISLRDVRVTAGDYNDRDIGDALEPHLLKLAEVLKENAEDRKTVVFLPLIETSRQFVRCLNSLGLSAVHVDGVDREDLEKFKSGEARIICNAQLLSTGWDQPDVDCVYILRPTKSSTLYAQMVGRGTRICDGKKDLLLLDPMFLAEKHSLIRPARLLAKDDEEADEIQEKLDSEEQLDLIETSELVKDLRLERIKENLKANARRKSKTVDFLEFALTCDEDDLAEYSPTMLWESQPMSMKQRESLDRMGFDTESIQCKGLACRIMDLVISRIEQNLASPKQMKWLQRFNTPDAHLKTFEEASAILDSRFGGRAK